MRQTISLVGSVLMGFGFGDWLRTGIRNGDWMDLEFPLVLLGLGAFLSYLASIRRNRAPED